MRTQIILVRHGNTDWNKINRIQGSCDVPLNEEGKNDAKRIAEELSNVKIEALYSSNLSRSYETAEIIGDKFNIKPIRMKELNEINQGVWQGLCIDVIKKRYKKQYSLWKTSPSSSKPPQGESIKEVYERVEGAIRKIIDKHNGQTICIVSHEVILALIKCYFKKENLDNIWKIAPERGSWETLDL